MSSPPPGFESFKASPILSGPPPGFASASAPAPAPAPAQAQAQAPAPIPNQPEYIKPIDYETRNQELKLKLMDLFDKKAFNEFMTLSIDFRNSCISAEDYLDRCRSLLDFR